MQGSIVLAIKNDCIFWLMCNCIFGILCCINRLRSTVFQLFFLTNAEETTKQINKSSIYTTAKCNPSCKSPSQQTFWCRMSIIITLKTRKSIKISTIVYINFFHNLKHILENQFYLGIGVDYRGQLLLVQLNKCETDPYFLKISNAQCCSFPRFVRFVN